MVSGFLRFLKKAARHKFFTYFLLFACGFATAKALPYYKMGWELLVLEFNRAEMGSVSVDGSTVRFYGEFLWGGGKIRETPRIKDFDKLTSVVEEAYRDFPAFIANRYGMAVSPRDHSLKIIFVGEETYKHFEIVEPSLGITFLSRIYLKSPNFQFDVLGSKSTIRHEIFHHLEQKSGLSFLPHQDAFDFGDGKDITKPR